jgi:hypothetical protein
MGTVFWFTCFPDLKLWPQYKESGRKENVASKQVDLKCLGDNPTVSNFFSQK